MAIAEAPGTVALFLGSGVSRDAGVPTGGEVLWSGLHRLRQLEQSSSEPVDDDTLNAWLEQEGRSDMTYSELLETIAPDAPTRRAYLAKFFEDREPGPTHRRLADLAARGLVRVFVTTNFDRLLETSLQDRGITPVVVSSDTDVDIAIPREHAPCVVVKPHGDYLQQTIRNTVRELATLDPGVTGYLAEILDRYGLVLLGYSGSDPAIAELLRARRSRYGTWWVTRSETPDLAQQTHARIIQRSGAEAFLVDLDGRLAAWERHPTGDTPAVLHDQALALLRAGDTIGVDELLRHEGSRWADDLLQVVDEAANTIRPSDLTGAAPITAAFLRAVERRLASLLPLAMHDQPRFGAEMNRLSRVVGESERLGGYTAWTEMPEFAAAWVGYVCGALLVRSNRIADLRPLVQATKIDGTGHVEPLVWLFGESPATVGSLLAPKPAQTQWISPTWEAICQQTSRMDWFTRRYSELRDPMRLRGSAAIFDLILTLAAGVQEHVNLAHFLLEGRDRPVLAFATRLGRDEALRRTVAEATGLDPQVFAQQAASIVRGAHVLGHGFSTTPADVARAIEGEQ